MCPRLHHQVCMGHWFENVCVCSLNMGPWTHTPHVAVLRSWNFDRRGLVEQGQEIGLSLPEGPWLVPMKTGWYTKSRLHPGWLVLFLPRGRSLPLAWAPIMVPSTMSWYNRRSNQWSCCPLLEAASPTEFPKPLFFITQSQALCYCNTEWLTH
jgi:hypothetical protein